ncbi:MAG: transaldolase [Planctomycetaceae bacterium]|nr:transaldolase [Planctomycetaceae bacterium]
MPTPLESLIAAGTKLWLDSVDPDLVRENRALGATGATSNPVIISDLIKTGRFDGDLRKFMAEEHSDDAVAWQMTDRLVRNAQDVFLPVWEQTKGNDGYVSFELDPLLEDTASTLSVAEKAARYIELGKKWSAGHKNRMIKVPATPGGLAALEELVAAGICPNITLIFSDRQYQLAREAVWRGAQRRKDRAAVKSVYSIFVSRIDVYTGKQVPELSPAAQGQVGLLNVQRIWQANESWWRDKQLSLKQEIVFASTGVKTKGDPADKYVGALAGSDIQTNPPETNAAVQAMTGKTYTRLVDRLPPVVVQQEIDAKVDFAKMEQVLMEEGLKKFADPQKGLIQTIAEKRAKL